MPYALHAQEPSRGHDGGVEDDSRKRFDQFFHRSFGDRLWMGLLCAFSKIEWTVIGAICERTTTKMANLCNSPPKVSKVFILNTFINFNIYHNILVVWLNVWKCSSYHFRFICFQIVVVFVCDLKIYVGYIRKNEVYAIRLKTTRKLLAFSR